MNVQEFLKNCRWQWPDFDESRALARYDHPRDRSLSALPKAIQGMATENKLMLLNLAVCNLAADEVYVEIGCWRGLSLAGAAFNSTGRIYACDDFSQFQGDAAKLAETIERYTLPGQVQFYDGDFLSFLGSAPWQPARIGVYFYDGGHTFEQQYQALEHVLPWLADEALVIIDDTNARQVRAANRQFFSGVSGFQLLSDVQTPTNEFPTWWNGVQVYSYQRETQSSDLKRPGWSYQASRLFWDGFMPPAREALHLARVSMGKIPGMKPLYKHFRQRQLEGRIART
jgi:predicted O-methyltransferase YrrM